MSSSDYSWNFSDWESALGLAVESLEDNIKGTDEIKLSSRLHKVCIFALFSKLSFYYVRSNAITIII